MRTASSLACSHRREYLGVHLILVIVVVGQHRVNLGKGQMRILEVHLFRAGAVSQLVDRYFDDPYLRVVNPGDSALIDVDMGYRNG